MADKKLFNDGWYFSKITESNGRTSWEKIDVPHDWLIYDAFNLYESSTGHYKKEFCCNKAENERIYIRFDGVYMDCEVLVNGRRAGEWKYGYSTFEFEITQMLKGGSDTNVLEVICHFNSPNSRWYSGAGIYRNVWLISKKEVCFVSDGIYVSSKEQEDGTWTTYIDTEIDMTYSNNDTEYSLRYDIFDSDGNLIKSLQNAAKENTAVTCNVENPVLWDIKNPYMYTLEVSLYGGDIFLEKEIVKYGYKNAVFSPEEGFILNGRKVKLHGVCNHHDLGCLGAAINPVAIRRQISILKEMGVNSIRTAHNMAAPELIEAANEMGILINAESFDMWECSKTQYDYARFFREWHEKDVKSWIKRDRNAPSVIMWCIGNEIYDTHKDEHGQDITKNLMELVHKYDYRNNAPVTIGSNYMPWENARKCADIVKLAGYNYAEKYYKEHHETHKDWIIYGSETASVVQSRGIYHFPADVPVLDDDDLQCSSLGNSTTSWGAKSIEKCITDERDAYFSAGTYLWSGFDYIGEPTPYHTKNSYFGQVDTAGFKKDSFYIYQAEWTDYKEKPMVHIWPYWDFNEGQIIDVCICSNAPEVELIVNGNSLGRKKIDHEKGYELVKRWKVPYKNGYIEAVAYDEDGNVIAKDKKVSFSDAKKICAGPDKEEITADGRDLIFIEIGAEDENGNYVENANNRISVEVTGAGRLVGLDNGDSTDCDSYKGLSKCLFSGKLLAVIAAKNEPGDIYVKLTSNGLSDTVLKFVSKSVDNNKVEGVSATLENSSKYTDMWIKEKDEIPVRKIELKAPFTTFDKEKNECEVKAVIYPSNATYKDIHFRATSDNGVTSNLVQIEENADVVKIKALGDGRFRLRCVAENGRGHAEVISELEFELNGIGSATNDAYGFVSGSLFAYSKGEVSNGNERGVATPRDHESHLYYENIDFGDAWADTITIPMFELESSPLEFEIWEGRPYDEGSEKLANAVYDKKSKWNTYQEESFKLSKRLKGITGIGFVFRRKAHIKGFSFVKINKAYEILNINDSTSIYGDTYTVKGDEVLGIGNNVTLVYEGMDFGENGISGIEMCGKTPLDNNTIHIRFMKNGQTINEIVEFAGSDEYVNRRFDLNSINGKSDVMFIFLPGSNFSMKWFRFY